MRSAIAAALVLGASLSAGAEELRGVDPKGIVDGDNFYVFIRLLGIDAPEEGNRAKCDQERALAKRAENRMKELLHGQVTLDIALEGELKVKAEGGEPRTYKAGEAFLEDVNQWHQAFNETQQPARILVVFMGEKDKPTTIANQ